MEKRRVVKLSALWMTSTRCAVLLLVLILVLYRESFTSVAGLAFRDERYSYTILIPIISVVLIYLRREDITRERRFSLIPGSALLTVAITLRYIFASGEFSTTGSALLSLTALSGALALIGVFILHYGTASFRRARFPMLLLVLMAPVPPTILENAVYALQKGSAEMTDALFRLGNIPFVRQDFRFSMPGVEIEITRECSGIRSSLSLLITALILGHLFLRSAWKRICLTLLTIPIVIFKNALRIVTITWLGTYVDRDFFHGTLHGYGGLPFSLVALVILGVLLFLFREQVPAHRSGGNSEYVR